MQSIKQNFTSGNMPIYITVGISMLLSISSYAYVSMTEGLRGDVDKIQDESTLLAKDVAGLKADNNTMKEWLTRVERKLDTVISK